MPLSSANMNLPIPVVGVDPGPDYATNVNACLTIIDQHDHTPGFGVAITPSGLNINSDLAFQDNSASGVKSVAFNAQASLATLRAGYFIADDFYINDGSGNVVRITQSGGVAGSPGSISNLTSPASASYVALSETFVWESDAGVAANMDFGAAVFRNVTPNSTYGVTLSAPAALGSNYSLVLPSLPASQKFMTLDASGNIAAPWAVDGSTLEVSSNTVQVKNSGITTAKIADGAVTPAKLAALGQQISSSSGSFSTTSTSYVDVTNLSVSITTTGRPVFIGIIADTTAAYLGSSNTSGGTNGSSFKIVRGSTDIMISSLRSDNSSATSISRVPPSSVWHIDTPSSGTYTYKVQCISNSGVSTSAINCKLIAYEL